MSTTRHYYAAIGSDGDRPVVCGLATTPALALREAAIATVGWIRAGWDACGTATVQVSRATVRRIRSGVVDCAALGIAVELRRGRIIGATRPQI